jgi:two-component system, NtrC family, nitrogen regulation sensor histidine kinase NtrY
MFNRLEITLTARVLLLLLTTTGLAYTLLTGQYTWAAIGAVVLVAQVWGLIRLVNKTNTELAQFLEAVQYRDFSLQFSEKKAPISIRHLRRAFNLISLTFKQLSSEKEQQYQYLQKVLELVDTGILAYDENGEVGWMNEALKKILNVPYLRNIHSFEKRDAQLYQRIIQLKAGSSELVQIFDKPVLLAGIHFRFDDKALTLIAFQNVNQAVIETESQAYQKLLRVMTHEIMNSVAPIASLADTLQQRLLLVPASPDPTQAQQVLDDVQLGIETIRKRSEGLLKFADTYRNLAKISKANFSTVRLRDLFENVEILMENGFLALNIELDVVLKDLNMALEADSILLEQMLINLLTNARDAVAENPEPLIQLWAYMSEDERPVIEVRDNGAGIPPEMLEQIFIPFFTSKKHGSGIGLSLTKQIMALHRGHIQVSSVVGQGTVFRLIF